KSAAKDSRKGAKAQRGQECEKRVATHFYVLAPLRLCVRHGRFGEERTLNFSYRQQRGGRLVEPRLSARGVCRLRGWNAPIGALAGGVDGSGGGDRGPVLEAMLLVGQ